MIVEAPIAVVVPGKPVPKKRPRVIAKGGRSITFTPRETVEHENLLGYWMKYAWRREPDSTSRFHVDVQFYMPHRHRVDCDNLVKSVLDAGNWVVWSDDSQVKKIHAEVLYDHDNPRTEIVIRRL